MALREVNDIVQRIRTEYVEMPGLSLTFWQAQRLWNLSDELCEQALRFVTNSGFLVRNGDGAYVRAAGWTRKIPCG